MNNYEVVDFRDELEYGVTESFQLALYLNHRYVYANNDVPAEDPAHPGKRLPGCYETGREDVRAGHNPATPFDSYRFDSVSLEAIYRLLNPNKHPVGLALYFEPTIGDQQRDLEWKIIVEKHWFEDRLVWALNINYGLEFERTDPDNELGDVLEWFTGASYRFVPSWSAGLEFWNHHEFADATVHKHSAYFVGPHNSLRRPTLVRHARVSSSTANWTGFQSRKQRVRRAQQLHFGGRARKILRAAESRI